MVAGEPLLGSDHTAIDVVAHQVFGVFGSLPLHKHGRLGVPGGDDLTGSRGDAWRNKNLVKNLVTTVRSGLRLSF